MRESHARLSRHSYFGVSWHDRYTLAVLCGLNNKVCLSKDGKSSMTLECIALLMSYVKGMALNNLGLIMCYDFALGSDIEIIIILGKSH